MTPAGSAPRIVFGEPAFDFGKVEQGEQVTHMFRFTNQGGQDLRIESVKTSCGCTAAMISADVIPPGQEGTISATFDTTHFSGEKAKGVTVYSNDPLQPVATLTLQGEITIPRLAELKRKWKVSMQALLYRTSDLGLLTDNQKRYLLQQFNQLDIRRREPPEVDVPQEKPRLLRDLIVKYRKAQGMNVEKMAGFFHLKTEDFLKMYAE